MNKAIRYCLLAAGVLALGYCIYVGVQLGQREVHHLTILHVNDTHSHMEPIRTGEYAGKGGILERTAYIDSVYAADGRSNVLLLHAGDWCQGTPYFSEFGAPYMVRMINAVGYDAITLGNHEFDNGIEALGEALSGCEVPVVVCNYDFSPFEAGKYIKPYVILEKAGLRIGVIGVLCPLGSMVQGDIANRLPMLDMVPTVQKYADLLRPQCDLVIALTHIGYTEHGPGETTDPQLCAATRNIDIFVGGHSHTFLEEAAMHPNLDGKLIPIVQTGEFGEYMGEFHIKM